MSELQDRLEQLAQRGTPRGGDAVIEAAKADVSQDIVTAIPMDAPRRKNPRRHFGSMIAAAGVAATLFVSMLAFSAFMGAGSGSDSPEGAVIQLADAVSNEDPLAAADVLAPEEVRSLSRTVDTAARRAQELQLARTAAAPLAGLDLSVDNLDLTTETLADGYVKVTVTSGTLSAGTEKDKFSPIMQRVLRDSDDTDSSSVDLAGLARGADLPTFVMAVERGGHWYVSAAYTALEYIREANDLPPADFGSGLAATATLGAASPEAAAQEAMQALAASDWQKLISLAPTDEIPVYDYRDALIELGRDTSTDFTIDDLSTSTVNVEGDTAQVRLTANGSTESGQWSINGACFKPPYSDEVTTADDWCGVDPVFAIPFYSARPESAREATITVVRKDGRWFVSPVGTVLDLVDRYLRDVTQRQFYTLLGVPQELPADATLILGQPVTPTDSTGGAYVYALEAKQGDRFLGLVTVDPPRDEGSYGGGEVLVYSPDGEILRNSYSLINGQGLEIPADGTYKVVVRPYFERITFTIWAEAQAPDAAKNPPDEGMYDGCEPTSNGGMTCSGSAAGTDAGSGEEPLLGSGDSSENCTVLPHGITECTSSSSSSGSGSDDTTATTVISGPGG